MTDKEKLHWKVHANNLILEISTNPEMKFMAVPLNMFMHILIEIAIRSTELNDPKMNALMCKLALYGVSDPHDTSFDSEVTRKTIELGYKTK